MIPAHLIFVALAAFCVTCTQAQYNVRPNTPVNIQWNNIGGVQVPVTVSVNLTAANTGFRRTNFPRTRRVENRMNEMNRRRDDERGHIIASQLGGPAQTWNLFPQSRNMNRNAGDRPILASWCGVENDIAEFLRGNNNRYVVYQISFSYNNRNEPRRPSHVTVAATFYERNNIVNQVYAPLRNERRPIVGVPRC